MGFAPAHAQSLVQASTLVPVTWRSNVEVAASLAARQSAVLAAPRGGIVTAVSFHSGASVAAGQVLVQLADGPEKAQRMLDAARLAEAGRKLARTEKLMSIAGASQSALEQDRAAQAEATAQLALDDADLAQLRIVAPFAGIVGIRTVDAGDYLQAGQAVVSLTAPGKLRVLFSIPQSESSDLVLGEPFTLSAPDGDGAEITASGELTALSPQIDPATDARAAEGQVTTGKPGLLAGMTATVKIATGLPVPAFAIPSTALNDSMLGPYVYVLNPAGGAKYKLSTVYVKIDDQSGAKSIIAADGLRAGEKILALGGFKLSDGASVTLAGP